jgi:hypothetical protein
VHAAVARQKAAYDRIADAANRLAAAGDASRDASAGVDGIAQALRERVATLGGSALNSSLEMARLAS